MHFNDTTAVRKSLPATPLWQWTATEIARAIRHKAVSSVEATQSVLDRIEQVNPRLNAIINLMTDKALLQARQADELLARGTLLSPLHGVPVTIKDNVDVKGERNTNGGVFRNRVSQHDSTIAENFNAAGCVTLGMTNLPEFALRFFTENPLFGRTLNPWDEALTPGGSSGGAAARRGLGHGFHRAWQRYRRLDSLSGVCLRGVRVAPDLGHGAAIRSRQSRRPGVCQCVLFGRRPPGALRQ